VSAQRGTRSQSRQDLPRRTPKQVTVLYFPKGGRPFRNRTSQTDVAVPVIDEVVTEVDAVAPTAAGGKRRKTKETALPEGVVPSGSGRTSSADQVSDLAVFGHQLFEQGRVEEARVIFEGLVSTGAHDAFPHTMLGTIYLAMGDQERALALFQAALELDPSDMAARVYRGEIRLSKGKMKLATEDLKRAVAKGDPSDPFVHRAQRLLQLSKAQEKRSRR